MSGDAWDPNELSRLRHRIQQLQQDLRAVDGRLGQLEQIASDHFAQRSAAALAAIQAQPVIQPAAPVHTVPHVDLTTPPPIPSVPVATAPIAFSISPPQPPPLAGTATRPAEHAEISDFNLAPEEPRFAAAARPQGFKHVAAEQPVTADGSIKYYRRQKNSAPIDWEAVIGGRWMTWAGAFTLLLAVGFAVHWAWTTLQTPPWVHILAFHLLGVGFLAGAHFLNRRGVPLAVQALVGLGIFTLYASAFAALQLYSIYSERTAFLECAAITALAIGLAIRANSPAVVLLGALGGYVTPVLTSSNSGNYVGLFTYLVFLNVALVGCAVWRGWSFLKPLALIATAIMFFGWWMSAHFDPQYNGMAWGTQWFAALHGLIFLIGSTLPPLAWKRVSRSADLFTLGASSLLFVGMTWLLFRDHPQQQLALVSWGMSALHLLLFALTLSRVTNVDRMPRVHLALAAVFFTLAIPLQVNDTAFWGATWCVEGFVFTAVGVYFADRQMCCMAAIVLILAAGRLIGWDWFAEPRTIGGTSIDMRFAMFLIAGCMTMLTAGMYRFIPWATDRKLMAAKGDEFYANTAGLLSALGAALITLSPMLQLYDLIYLAPVWAVEALAFTILGLALRDSQLRFTALVVFALAGGRLLGFDFQSQARSWGNSAIDLRCAAFSLVGLMALFCGAIYRITQRKQRTQLSADGTMSQRTASTESDLAAMTPIILLALGAILITCAAPLQLADFVFLGPVWGIEALLFVVAAALFQDLLLAVLGLFIFVSAAVRLGGWDFVGPPHNIAGTIWDVRFVVMEISGLLAIAAGGMYWLIPKLFGRRSTIGASDAASPLAIGPIQTGLSQVQSEKLIGGILAGVGNIALMLGLTCQWDNRWVLIAWTVDVALIWAAGFRLNSAATRWYAAALALLMVGGRAIHEGARLDNGFELILNSRFISLALVSILYFAAGGMYRRLAIKSRNTDQPIDLLTRDLRNTDESTLDPLFGILANAVLLIAMSMEIHSWYLAAAANGRTPFPDMRMAEMATYSIVWAVYAAIMVTVGFAIRYQLFRLLGLAAFGIIVLKVFFLDMESLSLLPRVLAFAVLGMTLLGVSMLYQKFAAETKAAS